MASKWWCAILPCDYQLADPPFGMKCTRCDHEKDAREIRAGKWSLSADWGWMMKWTTSESDEEVKVWWQDGSGSHYGWRFDVDRDGTEENPNIQGTNGYMDFHSACAIADIYMASGRLVDAMTQNRKLHDITGDHEFRVIDKSELEPSEVLLPAPCCQEKWLERQNETEGIE